MDFDQVSDEAIVELENTYQVRLLYNVLDQYKNSHCNREAAVMAILQLLQPDLPLDPPRRGAPRQEDPLIQYEARKQKIEDGKRLEARIRHHQAAGSKRPVSDAYAEFNHEKTYLDEARALWAEYGPNPWCTVMFHWLYWREMTRNNMKNIAKEAPVQLPELKRDAASSDPRAK